jgi:hypothetical protein
VQVGTILRQCWSRRNMRIKRTKRTKSEKGSGPARSGSPAKTVDPLEPIPHGGKRDEMSVCEPRYWRLPASHRSVSASRGALFPRLSKLLHQENALGAPCLDSDSCSPLSAPSRALRSGGLSWQTLMFFVVGGDARVKRTGAALNRVVGVRRLWRFDLTSTLVRFLAGIKRGKRFIW